MNTSIRSVVIQKCYMVNTGNDRMGQETEGFDNCFFGIACRKTKYQPGGDLIESIQPIGINEINTDIKPIHATYLIFAVAVKSESPKIRP